MSFIRYSHCDISNTAPRLGGRRLSAIPQSPFAFSGDYGYKIATKRTAQLSKNNDKSILSRAISAKEASDTGMALVLGLLLAWLFTKDPRWIYWSMGALVLTMTWVAPLKPLARLWLGFSSLMGAVVSRILLAVIFYGLVTPLALFRRLIGHDPMQRRTWKKSTESVFVTRDHAYTKKEIEHPF